MKRVVQIAALTGLVALIAGLAAAPAGAATPEVDHSKVNVSFTGIDVCGFTVDSVVQGTDTFHVFFDTAGDPSLFSDESHVISTLTNESNGKVVYVANASRDAFDAAAVANPDGTFTTTDTLTGMPVRIYTLHSSTLVKDVGFLSLVDTFDSQGNFLDEQVIEHGPHPGEFPFCDAITAAIA